MAGNLIGAEQLNARLRNMRTAFKPMGKDCATVGLPARYALLQQCKCENVSSSKAVLGKRPLLAGQGPSGKGCKSTEAVWKRTWRRV